MTMWNRFFLLGVVLTICACNKLEDMPQDIQEDIPPVVVDPTPTKQVYLDVSLGANFSHKWGDLDSISMFVMRDEQMDIEHPENNNVPAVYRYGAWSIESPITITDDKWKAYAYYPYTANLESFKVPIVSGDSVRRMVGKTALPFGFHNNNIVIEMWQPVALVTVYVRKQGKVERKVVDQVRLYKKNSGLPIEGLLDILSQSITYTKMGDYVKSDLGYEVSSAESAEPIDIEVLPTYQQTKAATVDLSSPTYLELMINDSPFSAELPKAVNDWESGNHYTINVIYNNDVVTIESVSIRPWNTEHLEIFPEEQ